MLSLPFIYVYVGVDKKYLGPYECNDGPNKALARNMTIHMLFPLDEPDSKDKYFRYFSKDYYSNDGKLVQSCENAFELFLLLVDIIYYITNVEKDDIKKELVELFNKIVQSDTAKQTKEFVEKKREDLKNKKFLEIEANLDKFRKELNTILENQQHYVLPNIEEYEQYFKPEFLTSQIQWPSPRTSTKL